MRQLFLRPRDYAVWHASESQAVRFWQVALLSHFCLAGWKRRHLPPARQKVLPSAFKTFTGYTELALKLSKFHVSIHPLASWHRSRLGEWPVPTMTCVKQGGFPCVLGDLSKSHHCWRALSFERPNWGPSKHITCRQSQWKACKHLFLGHIHIYRSFGI